MLYWFENLVEDREELVLCVEYLIFEKRLFFCPGSLVRGRMKILDCQDFQHAEMFNVWGDVCPFSIWMLCTMYINWNITWYPTNMDNFHVSENKMWKKNSALKNKIQKAEWFCWKGFRWKVSSLSSLIQLNRCSLKKLPVLH